MPNSASLNPPLKWSIPAFVLFSLCALYFVMIQTLKSGALPHFLVIAKLTPLILKPTYNYLPFVDKALGPLVIFFITAFYEPSSLTFSVAADFAWSLGSISLWQAFEAGRIGSSAVQGILPSILMCIPLWDFVGRRVGWSAIMSFWLLLFLHAPAHARSARIGRVKAEGILFGWWIGHNIPFAAVFLAGLSSTSVPLYLYALAPFLTHYASKGYIAFRRSRTDPRTLEQLERQSNPESSVLRFAYLSAFIVSAVSRAHLVLIPAYKAAAASPSITPLNFAYTLVAFFVPAHGLRQPPPGETTAQSGVLRFVQMNKAIGFSAVWIAILWELTLRRASAQLRNPKQSEPRGNKKLLADTKTIIVWGLMGLILISVFFGPGAATATILAYRESLLEKERLRLEKRA
ncbi:hypothetical protein EW145_g2579 [Phellinidium pouzarii]|uniref:Uncharacterized protein n=1 Tax=Phellinidium pouzarii TaxID=167371 RepID=A0A4S4LAF8_9AGAM|nr:hypothetical protein EW145_g2579 [Phellinidium pouzarii]